MASQSAKQVKKRSKSQKYQYSDLEKNITMAENNLNQQKLTDSFKKQKSHKNFRSSTPKSNSQKNFNLNNSLNKDINEINILNKKILQYKKGWEDEKTRSLRDRQKLIQVQEENEKLQRKIKKQEIQIEKLGNLEVDYQRLLQNYQKSEFIRNQQKQLIANIKQDNEILQEQLQQYTQKPKKKR
ncbi:hypothetical protein PPERSA_08806 [Pseudocohnilembus persalinus]|uniref:Uncharacterized protein n=1 Tax=Pseudocohnilembus persalinus TaxID=266149 RepID=A0A0V0R3L6_PSEPJ|nr:hypothetical protein PPERSA_08806 [Pseudocohnilembus persalinus]|eukprot:KRX09090.1 hypothetical protein PPERSA_08806 [Pseudocohnilembus persalinus]